MIETKVEKPEDRRAKTAELRKAHQEYFEKVGLGVAKFIPKLAYKPPGKDELFVGFFPNELRGGEDVYTEFTGRNLEIEDPERNLYKWRYNAHWEEEYEKTEPTATGSFRYLIPVSELIKVQKNQQKEESKPAIRTNVEFDLMDPDTDAPFDQLTIRDLAAILLKKPVSNKGWLNKLIQNN
jgi:hypothetical protein